MLALAVAAVLKVVSALGFGELIEDAAAEFRLPYNALLSIA